MAENIVKFGKKGGDKLPFPVGQEVILRSGGHYMTVRGVDENGLVLTDWIADDGMPCTGDYYFEQLMTRAQFEAGNVKCNPPPETYA